MEGLTLNTLPAWVVGIVMIYTALVWLGTRKSQIRMDSKTVAYTLLGWGTLYLLSIFSPESYLNKVDLLTRVFMSRVVICFICLAQSVPMTVSYIRGRGRSGVSGG